MYQPCSAHPSGTAGEWGCSDRWGPAAVCHVNGRGLPVYFVSASLLKHNSLKLGPLAHPVILLGALFTALALNSLSIMSLEVKGDVTPVLTISLSLRLQNIAVMGIFHSLINSCCHDGREPLLTRNACAGVFGTHKPVNCTCVRQTPGCASKRNLIACNARTAAPRLRNISFLPALRRFRSSKFSAPGVGSRTWGFLIGASHLSKHPGVEPVHAVAEHEGCS